MLSKLLSAHIDAFEKHYHYDMAYAHRMLSASRGAFLRFALFSRTAQVREQVPAAPWFAARIAAVCADLRIACWAVWPMPKTSCRTRGCVGMRCAARRSTKSAHTRREHHVRQWLPEPLLEDVDAYQPRPDVAHDLSFALLRTLDSLSPLERAAFLLRDVFDVDFTTIASTCAPPARVSRPGLKTADV